MISDDATYTSFIHSSQVVFLCVYVRFFSLSPSIHRTVLLSESSFTPTSKTSLNTCFSTPFFSPFSSNATDIRCYPRPFTDPPSDPASLRRSHRGRRRSSLLPQPERHARRALQLDSISFSSITPRIPRSRLQRHRSERETHAPVRVGLRRADR